MAWRLRAKVFSARRLTRSVRGYGVHRLGHIACTVARGSVGLHEWRRSCRSEKPVEPCGAGPDRDRKLSPGWVTFRDRQPAARSRNPPGPHPETGHRRDGRDDAALKSAQGAVTDEDAPSGVATGVGLRPAGRS